MLKGALALVAVITLAATTMLTLSLIAFRPPRANYQVWALWATVFAVHSLAALGWAFGVVRALWNRSLLLVGGAVLAVCGVLWVRDTLTSSHFEGYQLVLGAIVAVQGALAVAACWRPVAKGARS